MKSFLLKSKSFVIPVVIVCLFLFSTATGFAAVKTWNGGAGTNLSWTAGPWSPSAPVAGDDIVFNTPGVLTFTTGPAASISFNSFSVLQGAVTLPASAARILTIGGAAGTDFSISSGATFSIGTNVTITLAAGAAADITGSLVLSGGAFTANATSTVNYNEAGAQTVLAAAYGNLTISGSGAKTLGNNTTVSATLTIKDGAALGMSTFTLGTPTSVVMESGATGSSIIGSGLLTLGGPVTVNYTGSGNSGAVMASPVSLGAATRTFTIADDLSPATDLTVSGIISTANGLTKAGAGSMLLTNNNSYSGTTTVNAGTLFYGTNNAIAAGSVTVNGGTLDISTFSDAVGVVTLTSGTITGTSGILTGTSYTVSSGTISAILGGAGTLTKTTAGTVTLSALNTYTGKTTISLGVLSINSLLDAGASNFSSLGAPLAGANSIIDIDANATLQYTGAATSSNRVINPLADAITIDASGSGTLTLTGGISGTSDNMILTGLGVGAETGIIGSGTATLIKNGAGTWILSGANSYTGLTTINAGLLQYGANNVIADGAPVTVAGGTLDIATFTDNVGTVTLTSGTITGTSGVLTGTSYAMQSGTVSAILGGAGIVLSKTTGGTVILSGANTYSGGTSVSAGVLRLSNIAAAGNTSGTIALTGGILELATDLSVNAYNVTLTNTASIASGRATPGAGITHTLGTLSLGTGEQLNLIVGINVASGTAGLTMGTTTLTGATPVFDVAAGANLTLGALTGNNAFTKQNSGQLTLNTASTRTGGTVTLTAGTMKLGIANALGTTTVPLTLNGGVLDLAIDATVNAYPVTVNGNATIASDRATSGAGITHTLGTLSIGLSDQLNLIVGSNVASGTAGLTMGTTTLSASTPVFDVAAGANLTLGSIGGASAITKQGAGQMTLATASTRATAAGSTTLSAGILRLETANALNTLSTAVLNLNGGTLSLGVTAGATYNGTATVVGGTATVESDRLTPGAGVVQTLGTLSIGNFQLNIIPGSNVSSGTAGLIFGVTSITANAPVFDIAFGANLTLGQVGGNFAFSKQDNGLLILNTAANANRNTAASAVTINSGSIRVGNASAFGTNLVPIIFNGGSGLDIAIDGSINAHPVTINGSAQITSNRATPGNGITHTLGTLSIGNSTLTTVVGGNVTNATAGLTFGTTTFTANTPVFYATSDVNLTLGALVGNFDFNKDGSNTLILGTASARTGGAAILTFGTMRLSNASALGTNAATLQLNNGALELATDGSVNAYPTTVGGNATIISNRATAGAGVNHVLGTLSMGANTLTTNKGANATSGIASVQFGNFIMTGAATLNPNTANLLMAGSATGAFKLTKTGAGTLQKTATAWTLGGDFEISSGIYDATSQNTTMLGNWINNGGSLTAINPSAVIFNGGAGQSIGGTSSTIFNNLTINNSNGVSLATDETVNADLTLTSGILTIPTGKRLTIANGNPILPLNSFDITRYIITQVDRSSGAQGFLRVDNMTASAAYVFPVGDGTYYLPVTLTPSAVNTFSVCAFQGITTDGTPNGPAFSGPQKNNCVDAIWTVNNNNGTTTTATDMTVAWDALLEGVNFQSYGPLIGIAHYDGTPSWGPVVGTGDNNANTATRGGVTTFSPFGVGRIDPTGGVLAIKITYFNASKGNGYNTVNWQANCSSSQAIFEIERSTDGINFTTITTITATQARCAQPFSYTDNTAPSGTVFYRLKAVDVDGKSSYSAIVKLSSTVKDIQLDGITPNPVINFAQLKISTIKKDAVELAIVSMDGKVVYRSNAQLQPGISVVNVDISNLPAGMYMIKGVFSDGQTNTLKFAKK